MQLSYADHQYLRNCPPSSSEVSRLVVSLLPMRCCVLLVCCLLFCISPNNQTFAVAAITPCAPTVNVSSNMTVVLQGCTAPLLVNVTGDPVSQVCENITIVLLQCSALRSVSWRNCGSALRFINLTLRDVTSSPLGFEGGLLIPTSSSNLTIVAVIQTSIANITVQYSSAFGVTVATTPVEWVL